MDTRDALRDFFVRQGKGDGPLANDHPLLASGLLDSLSIVQLVAFIEAEFAVTIQDVDFDPENFETIDTIAELIARAKQ